MKLSQLIENNPWEGHIYSQKTVPQLQQILKDLQVELKDMKALDPDEREEETIPEIESEIEDIKQLIAFKMKAV